MYISSSYFYQTHIQWFKIFVSVSSLNSSRPCPHEKKKKYSCTLHVHVSFKKKCVCWYIFKYVYLCMRMCLCAHDFMFFRGYVLDSAMKVKNRPQVSSTLTTVGTVTIEDESSKEEVK